MSHNSFPLLPVDEILSCLESMEVNFTREMLMQPTEAATLALYQRLVEVLVISRADLKPGGAALASAESREALDNYSETFALVKVTVQLMKSVGVNDFSLSDITAPTTKRLVRCLSGVINFAKFHEEFLALYDEAMRDVQSLTESKKELSAVQATLETRLAAAQRERDAEEPARAALTKETEALRRAVQTLQTRTDEVRDEVGALNKNVDASKTEIKRLKAEVKAKEDDLERIRGQIVSSPEKLQQEINDYHVKIKRSNTELAALSAELSGFTSKHTTLSDVSKRLRSCTERARKLAADLERLHSFEQVHEEARARVADLQQQLEAAERESAKVTKEIGAVDTTVADLSESYEKKRIKLHDDLQTMSRLRDELVAELRRDEESISDTLRACDETSRRIAHAEREHKELVANIKVQYGALEAAVTEYQRRLTEAFVAAGAGSK